MDKTKSPSRTEALPSRTGPIFSIVVALVGPLCVVFVAGYLTIQLQLSEAGAFLLDFNARSIPAGTAWAPYLVRAAFVLLALAAILGNGHRRVLDALYAAALCGRKVVHHGHDVPY